MRRVEVLRALPGEPLQRLELLHGQREEVRAPVDHAALKELREDGPAGALDVHAAAADEVLVRLRQARRADRVRAVVAHGAVVLDDRLAHTGQVAAPGTRGHLRVVLEDRPDDLRDDVAGLLEDDGVSDPDVLAPDLVRLWSVARATVEPATFAGTRCATGVSVPVRPTYATMSSTTVSTCSGGNL